MVERAVHGDSDRMRVDTMLLRRGVYLQLLKWRTEEEWPLSRSKNYFFAFAKADTQFPAYLGMQWAPQEKTFHKFTWQFLQGIALQFWSENILIFIVCILPTTSVPIRVSLRQSMRKLKMKA
jgi:hypothetical protein